MYVCEYAHMYLGLTDCLALLACSLTLTTNTVIKWRGGVNNCVVLVEMVTVTVAMTTTTTSTTTATMPITTELVKALGQQQRQQQGFLMSTVAFRFGNIGVRCEGV